MSSSSMSQSVNYEGQVLLDEEEELIRFFKKTNLLELCKELESFQVTTEETTNVFNLMDHDSQDIRVSSRYLIQQVRMRVFSDAGLFDKFLNVLIYLDMDELEIVLTDQLGRLNPKQDKLYQSDLRILISMELLPPDKWKAIGTLLGLPKKLLDKCRVSKDACSSLSNVLSEWLTGKYLPRTLGKLKEAMACETVGLKVRAHTLVGDFWSYKQSHSDPSTKVLQQDPTFEVVHQTTNIKVRDGRLALLGVQVRPGDSASYQWMKDGLLLEDGELFSGTNNDILVLWRANQATKGSYTFRAEKGTQNLERTISVSVECPQNKQHLLDKYSKLPEVPIEFWSLPNENTFIDLVLLEVDYQQRNELEYVFQGDFNSFLKTKKTVEYDKVFAKYESGALIVVEGRPGSGKTALAYKIARDWASKGNILKYADYVFLLPLRGYQDKLIVLKLFSSLLKEAERGDGEGFCFILDGLDEWQSKSEYYYDKLIQSLLEREYLLKAMVIVTSRPASVFEFRHRASKLIQVFGFSEKSITRFIDHNLFNGLFDLKSYLVERPNALSMCYLPIHLVMTCFLTQYTENMPQTETQLYEEFTRLTILHELQERVKKAQLSSLDSLGGQDEKDFQKVCKLAFDMICKSKQVKLCGNFDSSPSLSLLTVDRLLLLYGVDDATTFHHLTHQEYLAAYHIASLTAEEQCEIITLHGSRDNIQTMWKFYCGILGKSNDRGNLFELLMRTVTARPLFKVKCAYESQQVTFCKRLLELESGHLDFFYQILELSDLTAMEYVLKEPSHSLYSLSIFLCSITKNPGDVEIGMQNLQKLTRGLNSLVYKLYKDDREKLKHAVLASSWHTGGMWRIFNYEVNPNLSFAKCIVEPLKCCTILCRLDLSANFIGSEGAASLAEVLKNLKKLEMLDISFNAIKDEGAKSLAKTLKHCTKLEVLNLAGNAIGYSGAKDIIKGTKMILTLKDINIACNDIRVIISADYYCLQSLNMSGNSIGPSTAKGINFPIFSSTLQILILCHNNIDCKGAITIAKAIKPCHGLQKLNLSYNNIRVDGAMAIAVNISERVRVLDLSNNNIGQDCEHLVAEFNSYRNLKFDLSLTLEPSSLAASTFDAEILVKQLITISTSVFVDIFCDMDSLIPNFFSKRSDLVKHFSTEVFSLFLDILSYTAAASSVNSSEGETNDTAALLIKKFKPLPELQSILSHGASSKSGEEVQSILSHGASSKSGEEDVAAEVVMSDLLKLFSTKLEVHPWPDLPSDLLANCSVSAKDNGNIYISLSDLLIVVLEEHSNLKLRQHSEEGKN